MVRGRGAAEGVDNKIIIMTKATEKTERTYALQLNANCEVPEELERERECGGAVNKRWRAEGVVRVQGQQKQRLVV